MSEGWLVDKSGRIEVRQTDSLGRAAFANCEFSPGERVLMESPFLSFYKDQQREQAVCEKYGPILRDRSLLSFAAPVFMLQPDKELKKKLKTSLELFYSPPMPKKGRVKRFLDASAAILKDVPFDTTKDFIRFCHIVDLNIHRDDENSLNFPGLFVIGSKFSHSCSPNCAFQFDPSGDLVYYAVRPIKKGDMLTFSYIGDGFNLLSGTVSRRVQLGRLLFVCECARCLESDTSRTMLCPGCKEISAIPYSKLKINQADYICKAMNLEIPESFFSSDTRWACAKCGDVTIPEEQLKAERYFESSVPSALDSGERSMPLEIRQNLLSESKKVLGWKHWVVSLLTFSMLQRVLRNHHSCEGPMPIEVVQRACRDMMAAMKNGAPHNSQQLLRAAGLVAHVAKAYGSPLTEDIWGIPGGGCPFGWSIHQLVTIAKFTQLEVLLDKQSSRFLYEGEWFNEPREVYERTARKLGLVDVR